MVDSNNFSEEIYYKLLLPKTTGAREALFYLDLFIRASRDNNVIFDNNKLIIIYNALRDFRSDNFLSNNDMRDLLTIVRKKFYDTPVPEPELTGLQLLERQLLKEEERGLKSKERQAKAAVLEAKRAALRAGHPVASAGIAPGRAAEWAELISERTAATKARPEHHSAVMEEQKSDQISGNKGGSKRKKSKKNRRNKISKRNKRMKSISLKRRHNRTRHAK